MRPLSFRGALPNGDWDAHKSAGTRAYKKGNYAEAEAQFAVALKQA